MKNLNPAHTESTKTKKNRKKVKHPVLLHFVKKNKEKKRNEDHKQETRKQDIRVQNTNKKRYGQVNTREKRGRAVQGSGRLDGIGEGGKLEKTNRKIRYTTTRIRSSMRFRKKYKKLQNPTRHTTRKRKPGIRLTPEESAPAPNRRN